MDADAQIASRAVIVSTAPCNPFGAATAHSRYLEVLRDLGARTFLVHGGSATGTAAPARDHVGRIIVDSVRSDAYPASDVIDVLAVGERMAAIALDWHRRGYNVQLIGSFLFPFCLSVIHAASLLEARGVHAGVVIIPAGSDIWQIGQQLIMTTSALLTDPRVSARVTYSHRFAGEINRLLEAELPFSIIPPPIDVEHFRPCSADEKRHFRQRLGLRNDDFVLVNCSNMRPVKELGLSLAIARSLSEALDRRITLLLVGPVTGHLIDRLGRMGLSFYGATPQHMSVGKLDVLLAGLQDDPRPYLWSADLAINTSLHDSFNISLAESMACGLPVLTTDGVGICELPGISDAGHFFHVEGDQLGHLCSERGELTLSIDTSLPQITRWTEQILMKGHESRERSTSARSVVERCLAKSVIAIQWARILNRTGTVGGSNT